MGLAAAWLAQQRGFQVTVVEKGDVGAGLERWGPVRFFTPLSMNMPAGMLDVLGPDLDRGTCLTGLQMRDEVLRPLVAQTALRDAVRTNHRVVSVSRKGMTKGDYAGHPMRAERPFLTLVRSEGEEFYLETDLVFDATGGYVVPNHLGAGGLPALGEAAASTRIIRDHATLQRRAAQLKGRQVLLVGHGHSAANALLMLEESGARVTWSVRTPNLRPCVAVAGDPLPERASVVDQVNGLAERPPAWLEVRRRSLVRAVTPDERLRTEFFGGEVLDCDAIVAFTGSGPDDSHVRELQVAVSPVTGGGDRLWRAISNVTDCLSVPRVNPHDLASGEPGFWFIGGRSYGRARTFLLQTGLQHVERILDGI